MSRCQDKDQLKTLNRASCLLLAGGATLSVGCAGQIGDPMETLDPSASASETGESVTELCSDNGLPSINGLSAMNGLSTMNGLSAMNGLMTTSPGRATVAYMVRCALAAGDSLVKKDQYNVSYTYPGSLGLAPQWKNGSCDTACQEILSACMMAHVNTTGKHVSLWL